MEPLPEAVPGALFETLEEMRREYDPLRLALDADCSDEPAPSELWPKVQSFVERLAESGVYFDEPHEVKACQDALSYCERALSRASADKRFVGDPRVPDLKPYDETALRALQGRYTNPFEGLAAEAQSLPADAQETTRSRSDELAKLIKRRAAGASVRFEHDLVKEIVGQLAGDPFAPTLIEFCLYHLFEDPHTRVGNKLRRPPPERTLSCLQYLVDRVEWLHGRQGPREQQVMLDALAWYGARVDPGMPSDALISGDRIEAIKGARSSTFMDTRGRTLALRPFLVSSRLLFDHGLGLAIVHPALFRRWPRLLSGIGEWQERARWRRRAWLYGAALVASALAISAGFMFVKVRAEAKQAEANALAAEAYANLWKYEGCRESAKAAKDDDPCTKRESLIEMARSKALEAVQRSPTRRAIAALNDAIAAMLGANAKTAGADRALAYRAPGPAVAPCVNTKRKQETGPFCFVDSQQRRLVLPGLTRADVVFGADPKERRVAIAWPRPDPRKGPDNEDVMLATYRVAGDALEPEGPAVKTHCRGNVTSVRVSEDAQAIAIDCEPSGDEDTVWDAAIASDADDAGWRTLRDALGKDEIADIKAVYFASPGTIDANNRAYAALRERGILEIIAGGKRTEAKDSDTGHVTALESDVLRLMGRPDHLAFHSERGFAAVGTFQYGRPLVMVHTAKDADGLSQDDIHPVPSGLGQARDVNYLRTGKCIEVRTALRGNSFAYHIILDPFVLQEVARRMAQSPPRYDATSLCE